MSTADEALVAAHSLRDSAWVLIDMLTGYAERATPADARQVWLQMLEVKNRTSSALYRVDAWSNEVATAAGREAHDNPSIGGERQG